MLAICYLDYFVYYWHALSSKHKHMLSFIGQELHLDFAHDAFVAEPILNHFERVCS